MLVEILSMLSRDDLIKTFKCIGYGLCKNQYLENDELCFMERLGKSFGLNDYEREEIYTTDIRYPIDVNTIIKGFSLSSAKALLFITEVASIALNSKSLKDFTKNKIVPALPFNDEIKNNIIKTVPKYIESTSKIYCFIWGIEKTGRFLKTEPSSVAPYQKLFFIDHDNLMHVTQEEKAAFFTLLIHLMLDDNNIDEGEKKVLKSLMLIMNTNLDILDDIDSCKELNTKIFDSTNERWINGLLIFYYLYTREEDLDDAKKKRLSFVLHGFDISESSFGIFNNDVESYKSSYKRVIEAVLSKNISTSNEEKNSAYAQHGLSIIGAAMPFIPIIGPTLGLIQKASTVGGGLLDKRSVGIMEFGLTDIIKKTDNETIVVCIDGFLSELADEQFVDWEKGIEELEINAWVKGFKWPSSTAASIFKSGGSAWYEAVNNTAKAGARLANDIDVIYGFRPDANIVLMGHSLGARVILNTMTRLHDMNLKVQEIYLFGGAVSTNDKAQWLTALSSVKHRAYNFYSSNDEVLNKIYKGTMLGDNPAGLGEINHFQLKGFSPAEIINIDVTDLIGGHTEYKDKLGQLLNERNGKFGLLSPECKH